MNREDVHKLLGGYATGTLTPEEQQALFEAALEDQELFDALAREQALRDVLGDPASRAHLLAALDEPARVSWFQRWWRPLLPITVAAMAAILVVIITRQPSEPADSRPVKMAKLEPLPAPVIAPPATLPPPPVMVVPPAPSATPLSLPVAAPPPPPPPVAAPSDSAPQNKMDVQVAAGAMPAPKDKAAEVPRSPTINGLPGVQGSPSGLAPSTGGGFVAGIVPVRGVVLDPSGAAIPAVTVEMTSLATGEIARMSTDAKGEFSAPGVAGGVYEIRASAPGFQTATIANAVVPAAGLREPIKLQLQVGTVTETVAVSELAKRPPGAGGGRGGGAGSKTAARSAPAPAAPQAQAAPATQQAQSAQSMQDLIQQRDTFGNLAMSPRKAIAPPVQYRLLRKVAQGNPVDIGGDGLVDSGADVILQVTARSDGYVRVTRSNGRDIAPHFVLAAQPYEIPLGKLTKKGLVNLQLVFSTEPFEAKKKTQAAAAGNPVPSQTRIDIAINVR